MEQNSHGHRTGRPNHPVRRRPPLNRDAQMPNGRYPQQDAYPFKGSRPLRNPDDVPRRKKPPPLDEYGMPRRRKRPPLDENGMPHRRKRPPLDENGMPRRRKRPPLDENGMPRRSRHRRRTPHSELSWRNGAKKIRKRLHRFPVWIPLLVVYVIALVLISRSVVRRVGTYMAEYEASRPQYVMDEYVGQLDDGFYNTMLHNAAANLSVSKYETTEAVIAALPLSSGLRSYTYVQNTDASTADKPVYDILCSGKAIASVALLKNDETARFGMPLWEPAEPVSRVVVTAEPQYSLSVVFPADAVLTVNGQTVSAAELTEADPEIELDTLALKFGEQPENRKFELSGLYLLPEVTVTDTQGRQLEPESRPAPDEAQQTYVFERAPAEQPDDALIQRVNALTRAYFNYVSNNGRNGEHNLAVLNQYLVLNSSAYRLMASIISDIKWNNQYNLRDDKLFEISRVTMYSDTLCVCEVKFDIVLTKVITNEYTGRVRWTMIHNGYNWFAEDVSLLPLDS